MERCTADRQIMLFQKMTLINTWNYSEVNVKSESESDDNDDDHFNTSDDEFEVTSKQNQTAKSVDVETVSSS